MRMRRAVGSVGCRIERMFVAESGSTARSIDSRKDYRARSAKRCSIGQHMFAQRETAFNDYALLRACDTRRFTTKL